MNHPSEGKTLGKYQLLERLGRGGMADVYRAFQPGLDRYVAIKVLHAHLQEGENFVERFKREARAVAALRHPNIVNVFDFDVEDDKYYMVMDYVEGSQSLKEVLQDYAGTGQRLSVDQAVDIAARLADALAYAHDQGMIHRDVKPSNVLMTNLATPVLADFGIARMMNETGLTGTGAMIGTPAYMSPEQGRGEPADERSDIYALGIVLYEMLTGIPPYDADTPYAVILKHIHEPLVSPRRLIENLPAAVEMIVLKSLAKDAADRYQAAGAMAAALREAHRIMVDSTPTSYDTPPMPSAISGATEPMSIPAAHGTSITPRSGKRFPWLLAAGGAVIVLIMLAAGAILILRPFSGGVTDGPPDLPEQTTEGGETTEVLIDSSDVQELFRLGYEQLRSGADKEALGYFNRALEINPDSANALAGQSIVFYYSGDEQAAAEAAFRAGEIDPNNPYAAFAVGNIYSNTSDHYDPQAALEWFNRAVDGCGEDAFLCAEALGEKASIESWNQGDYEAGIADLSHAIDLDPDPNSASYRISNRADMYYSGLGDSESAYADLEHAYEINPDYSFIQQAARIAIETGELDRAQAYFERLISEHNGEPAFVAGRGYLELLQGRTADAHASADLALSLNPDLLPGHYLLGVVLMEEGNPQDAIGQFQFITEREDVWYNDAQYTPGLFTSNFGHELYYDLAQATWGAGDADGALGLIEAGIEREDWAGPYVLRGDILADQGDLAGAREAYLTALDYAYDDPDLQTEIQDRLAGLSGG